MVLLAIAQAPQAFPAQAQAQEIVSDLPEDRRVVNSEGPGPAATSQQAPAPQIDPTATYRLASDYLAAVFTSGPGKSLSVSKSGDNYVVVMDDTKESPEQLWKFLPLGGGKYRLINVAAGDSKSLSTQMSGERYVLSIQNTDGSTGQIWTLTAAGDGKYRLSNDALAGRSLYISALDPSFRQFLLQMTATSTAIKQVWSLKKSTVTLQLANPTLTTSGPVPTGGQPAGGGLVVTGLGPKFQSGQQFLGTLLCPIIGPGPKLINGCQGLFAHNPALASRTSGPATLRGPAKTDACPSGFRDDGDYCAKPEAYGRGVGYISMGLCESSYGQGNCEQTDLLYYPKCKTGFQAFGCCVCSPKCPDGQLVALADKPVSIAQILQSGSDDEKNSLIMWWALATSPYKPSATAREFPMREADVCATYPSQCADIKRIVTAVRPTR